jgi:hypothetical protein
MPRPTGGSHRARRGRSWLRRTRKQAGSCPQRGPGNRTARTDWAILLALAILSPEQRSEAGALRPAASRRLLRRRRPLTLILSGNVQQQSGGRRGLLGVPGVCAPIRHACRVALTWFAGSLL